MKLNKLLAGLGAAVLTAALAVTASAADPLVVWDFTQADNTVFYNADGTVAFDVNGATAAYDADNACLNIDVDSGDPYFILPNQGTFPAENSFVRVKYNLTDISDWSTSIYFTTDTVQWSETGHWKGIYDGDDGEWCEQTFYMTECAAWAGTITDMRLDIFDSAWAGQNAKVAYVAVFGNEADANAFDFAAWQNNGRPVTLEAAPAAAETTAAPAAASDRKSAVEVGGAGIFTYDESDGEYWSPALTMLDKSGVVMALEDGSIVGYSDVSTYTDTTGVQTMATMAPGWYEVVLCNLGTNPEWFPADVKGKVALAVRGDSTFTVKSENAMNAGAVACLIGNNCRAIELVDETGVMTGEYENVSMSVDYYTIPMCALSSDVTARLVAQTADISIADAVVAVENVFFGDLELSVEHKKVGYIFLGTLEEYEANKTRTDANTVTLGGGIAGAAEAATAPEAAAPAAEATASAGLPAAYPSSGTEVPADSVLIAGELIGSELGWDGTAASGRASAFDGDPATFFDPATASVDWCGIDAGEEMILTKIVIRPRDSWADRFDGATIEASNDPEFEDSVELFYNANGAAAEITYIDCTADMDADANTGYRYFRYINYMQHGDVSEVELYGKAVDGSNPTYGAEAATEAEAPAAEEAPATEAEAPAAEEPVVEEPAVEEPAAEEVPAEEPAAEEVEEPVVVEEEVVEEAPVEEAAETFDFGVIAVVAAIVSAAGYAISKKR